MHQMMDECRYVTAGDETFDIQYECNAIIIIIISSSSSSSGNWNRTVWAAIAEWWGQLPLSDLGPQLPLQVPMHSYM